MKNLHLARIDYGVIVDGRSFSEKPTLSKNRLTLLEDNSFVF